MDKENPNSTLETLNTKNLKKIAGDKNIPPGVREVSNFAALVNQNRAVADKIAKFGFEHPEAIIAYAKDLGFSFARKDLTLFAELMLDLSAELSDEELEAAAGGFYYAAEAADVPTSAGYVGLIASAAAIAIGKNNAF